MSYTIRQNLSPFYEKGRSGFVIDKIVIHHSATTNFDGIGATFKQAGVSAHYGVGRDNNVDIYVTENNTAWHAGDLTANRSSIGIENVNKTGAPDWLIDDSTFNTLVELCKDIILRNNLGKLEVGRNLFGHKDFSATACPASLYSRLVELADRVNGRDGTPTVQPVEIPQVQKSNEEIASEVLAGSWGNGDDRRINLENAGYNYDAIQSIVNRAYSNGNEPNIDDIVQQVLAGSWGNGDDRRINLENAGYNYDAIQQAVNNALGFVTTDSTNINNGQIADEVIAGSWGNGDDRRINLENAGYNYFTIQSIVNRKLGY